MPWDGDRQKDYIQVDERIQKFYERFPEGRLQSEIVEWVITDRGEHTTRNGKQDVLIGHVLMKGLAYRTPDDPLPGIGFSSMILPGGTPYTRNSEIENAETSAWGRAIAALGVEVRRGIATAEEVRNKEHDGEGYQVRITPSSAEQPQKGGHQTTISRPQVNEIIQLSKSLDYNPTEMADVICGLIGRDLIEMPEDEEEQKTTVKRLLVSLTAEEAGTVIRTLIETQEAMLASPEGEMDSEEGLPDIPDAPETPTTLEDALQASLDAAGITNDDRFGS